MDPNYNANDYGDTTSSTSGGDASTTGADGTQTGTDYSNTQGSASGQTKFHIDGIEPEAGPTTGKR